MLLFSANNITMAFGHKAIISQAFNFKMYTGDKIGIVGMNGTGKTTLMKILAGEIAPDTGSVDTYTDIHVFKQINDDEIISQYSKEHSELCNFDYYNVETLSGGENTRLRLANVFNQYGALYFFDEPTTNMDISGKAMLIDKLNGLESFILICHDRYVLDECCNKILEIENEKCTLYDGDYSKYLEEKALISKTSENQYLAYLDEKHRLNQLYKQQLSSAEKISKKPKDKGKQQSGRFFGGRSKDATQKAMQKSATAALNKIAQLKTVEKPFVNEKINFDFKRNNPPKNKIVVSIENLNFAYGDRVIFDDATCYIENGEHLAILGDNGTGKSTLFKLIINGDKAIYVAPQCNIGYFSQTLSNIDLDKSVYQNAAENSVQDTSLVRLILRRLLFETDDLDKLANVLSGGERVRLSLAKLMLSNANVLMLDEVTNYLDIPSINAIEQALNSYPGTIIFTAHDKNFINNIATKKLVIENKKLVEWFN